MVDLLVLVHRLINVRLNALTGPEDVPFVTLSLAKSAGFHDAFYQFCIGFDHLKEHLKLGLFILARLGVTEHVYTISIYLEIATKIDEIDILIPEQWMKEQV